MAHIKNKSFRIVVYSLHRFAEERAGGIHLSVVCLHIVFDNNNFEVNILIDKNKYK